VDPVNRSLQISNERIASPPRKRESRLTGWWVDLGGLTVWSNAPDHAIAIAHRIEIILAVQNQMMGDGELVAIFALRENRELAVGSHSHNAMAHGVNEEDLSRLANDDTRPRMRPDKRCQQQGCKEKFHFHPLRCARGTVSSPINHNSP
jgi:hypothetical protein